MMTSIQPEYSTQRTLFPYIKPRYFVGHHEDPRRQIKAAIAMVEILNGDRPLELYSPETLKLITYSDHLPLYLLIQVARELDILKQREHDFSASKEFQGTEKRYYNLLLQKLMQYRYREETKELTKGDFLNDLAHFTQYALDQYDAAPFHIAAMIQGKADSREWVENEWYPEAVAYWKPTPDFRAWHPDRKQRLDTLLKPVYDLLLA